MAKHNMGDHGTLGGPPTGKKINDYMIIDDRVYRIHTVVAHRFRMGDVDDPDLYAAQPIWEWQQTEAGKFIMSRAVDTPEWHRYLDPLSYGYNYAIVAKIKDVDYTFWCLKWADEVNSVAK